jgi:hypothetical protein
MLAADRTMFMLVAGLIAGKHARSGMRPCEPGSEPLDLDTVFAETGRGGPSPTPLPPVRLFGNWRRHADL